MNIQEWKAAIEGALFLAGDEGVPLKELSKMIEMCEDTTRCIIEELQFDYGEKDRGISIAQMGTSFYMTTKKEHALYYQKLFLSTSQSVLSQAALETLAIIAYKQPITRIQIEEIRGVKTDRPIQSLLAKSLIKDVGRADAPGRPILYGTTNEFLQYFNLRTLLELPKLSELQEDQSLEDETDLFLTNLREDIIKDA